jgi:RecA/RadA recombinase
VSTALRLLQRADVARLSSGVASLDALLDGGCAAGRVVEVYGASGSGASLLAHALAIRAVTAHGAALWFDSANGAFSPRRALALVRRALASRRAEVGVDDAAAASTLLSRMLVSVAVDAFALLRALRHVAAAPVELAPWRALGVPLRLLVVDSLGALLTPLVSTPGAHELAQATLALIARQLKAIAVEHNAVVLVVNYALQDGHPALGRAWRYVAQRAHSARALARLGARPRHAHARQLALRRPPRRLSDRRRSIAACHRISTMAMLNHTHAHVHLQTSSGRPLPT